MLFHKRTKKVIKYLWGGFSIIIALSMVFAYSGFTLLSGTSSTTNTPPVEISNENVIRDATGSEPLTTDADPTEDEPNLPPTPPPAPLDFTF